MCFTYKDPLSQNCWILLLLLTSRMPFRKTKITKGAAKSIMIVVLQGNIPCMHSQSVDMWPMWPMWSACASWFWVLLGGNPKSSLPGLFAASWMGMTLCMQHALPTPNATRSTSQVLHLFCWGQAGFVAIQHIVLIYPVCFDNTICANHKSKRWIDDDRCDFASRTHPSSHKASPPQEGVLLRGHPRFPRLV